MRSTRRAATFTAARFRVTTLLLFLSLLATACGARLTDEQRELAIQGVANSGGGSAATTTGDQTVAAPTTDGGAQQQSSTSDQSTTTTGADTTGDTSTADSTEPAAGGPGDASSTDTTDTGDSGSQATAPSQTTDTRAAPAGGNGGATDVGITEDSIVIGNASDISGAVPGLFEDAQQAVQAFVAYFTATEGTIYGRQLDLRLYDSKMDSGENRRAYLDMCEVGFAGVGSMSAFDDGVAGPVSDCGIPDLRSASVNPATMDVENVYSSDALSSEFFPMNHYLYWKEQCGGCEQRAGMLYINNDTTTKQTRQMIGATQKVGYEWVYDQAIDLAETNYSTFVIDLKEKDVQFVQFQGDYTQVVRLAEAMHQQDYWPKVFALQQNIYTPNLIELGGDAVEGVQIAVGSVLLENIEHHPELQLYRQWLKQIDPEAEPTGMGMYGWAAAKLFVEIMKEIGPEPTRAKFLEALSQVSGYTANGLIPPQEIGAKMPSNCHIIVEVRDGAFVPVDPPDGLTFNCRGEVASQY